MSNRSEKVWKKADNTVVKMEEMQDDEIKQAFLNLCMREFNYFLQINKLYNKLNTYDKLKKQLKEEATLRNLTLNYPDQKMPSEYWRSYFEAERKNDAIQTTNQSATIE